MLNVLPYAYKNLKAKGSASIDSTGGTIYFHYYGKKDYEVKQAFISKVQTDKQNLTSKKETVPDRVKDNYQSVINSLQEFLDDVAAQA